MTLLKYGNFVMIVAFLFSVIVQYNDPDPLVWMAIYGAAMIACILFAFGKSPSFLPRIILSIAVIWALTIAAQVIGKVGFSELFQAFEMKDERVEVGREFGGLLIIVFWMSVLAIARFRRGNKFYIK
jgi:uncharacterized membrane protein